MSLPCRPTYISDAPASDHCPVVVYISPLIFTFIFCNVPVTLQTISSRSSILLYQSMSDLYVQFSIIHQRQFECLLYLSVNGSLGLGVHCTSFIQYSFGYSQILAIPTIPLIFSIPRDPFHHLSSGVIC